MPALQMQKYGLESLYLFPYYQDTAAYTAATGRPATPFNPTRPPKFWFDPAAATSVKRTIVYAQVLAVDDQSVPFVADGKPVLDILAITREEAASVNIPSKGKGSTNEEGAGRVEVMPPLRPLERNEELLFGFGNTVFVHNTDFPLETTGSASGSFTAADRALLQAIAKKLAV